MDNSSRSIGVRRWSNGAATAVAIPTIIANPRMLCIEWPEMAGSSRNPGTSFIVSRSMYAAGFQPLGSCRVCGKMYPRCCIRVDTLVVSRLATRGRVHVTLCTRLDASFCSSLGFEKHLVHACKQFKRQGLLKAMLRIDERKNYSVRLYREKLGKSEKHEEHGTLVV